MKEEWRIYYVMFVPQIFAADFSFGAKTAQKECSFMKENVKTNVIPNGAAGYDDRNFRRAGRICQDSPYSCSRLFDLVTWQMCRF